VRRSRISRSGKDKTGRSTPTLCYVPPTLADLRSRLQAGPPLGDAVLALALTAASLALITLPGLEPLARGLGIAPAVTRPPDATGLVLAALCTLPVAFRRSRPLLLLALTTLPEWALHSLAHPTGLSGLAALILLYTASAGRGLAMSLLALGMCVVRYAGYVLLVPGGLFWRGHLAVGTVIALCWLIGRTTRLRRAYLAELEERAARLERAREADTRAARAEERSRIARELHDVVAHHVSVMTVQAAAARRVLDNAPDAARDALTAIEQMGRAALAEMRNIVGVLRTGDPAERAPQPGMRDLPALVEQMREAGLAARLRVEGVARPLPPGIDLAAYRLVQEALTNSLRHAGPSAQAWVTVRYDPGELTVHVEDDGGRPDGKPAAGGTGGGHGLVGIRERVALYGGRLRIGPRPGGGFEVRAHFPLKDGT